MLSIFTDALDPLEELQRLGIDARLVWAADAEHAALVLVPADPETLLWLAAWLEPEPAQRLMCVFDWNGPLPLPPFASRSYLTAELERRPWK